MSLDDKTDVLIAVGASAAVNCRPCLGHHLDHAKALGVGHDDLAAAVQTGLQVNRGAAAQTRAFTSELFATATDHQDDSEREGEPVAHQGSGCR